MRYFQIILIYHYEIFLTISEMSQFLYETVNTQCFREKIQNLSKFQLTGLNMHHCTHNWSLKGWEISF